MLFHTDRLVPSSVEVVLGGKIGKNVAKFGIDGSDDIITHDFWNEGLLPDDIGLLR